MAKCDHRGNDYDKGFCLVPPPARWSRDEPNQPSPVSGYREIVMLDALALSQAIRSKHLSCVEVMIAYLDHIERLNPRVNAIVSLRDRNRLVAEARGRDTQLASGEYMGWMHGFPQAIKDAGFPAVQGLHSDSRLYLGRTNKARRRDPNRQDQHARVRIGIA
jgi:hypothetical protein